MKNTLITLAITLFAVSLFAQTKPRSFADSPAKWLMTAEEQRAWKNVKTDDQAIDFIDLFWARRDPTPGTGRNENRLEFENRVAFADQHFKEGRKRGSLTERGRVYIVLGAPKNFAKLGAYSTGMFGNPETTGQRSASADGGGDPTGGRALAAKDIWEYTHETAVKYNVPKIEVVFIYDGFQNAARRDPQRTDFTMALPGAINYYITSPELTTVPEWASSRVKREAGEQTTQHIETTETSRTVTTSVIVDARKPVAKPAGIGDLMLVADSMSLEPQSGTDPLASVAPVTQFKRDRELGWATSYCSGEIAEHAPALNVQLKFLAENGDSFSTDPEEFVPDSIKASPGCYLLRGSVPLMEMEPGPYKVTVTITGAAGGQSYNLTRDFRVE